LSAVVSGHHTFLVGPSKLKGRASSLPLSRTPAASAWWSHRPQPSLRPECGVQEVSQPDARTLEPIADEWDVLFQICGIHDDHLLVRALGERFVPWLIEAFRANPDAILYGPPPRHLEGFVRPARDRHGHPCGPVAVG